MCGQIQEGIQNICKLASPWQDVGWCCITLCLSLTLLPAQEAANTTRQLLGPGLAKYLGS